MRAWALAALVLYSSGTCLAADRPARRQPATLALRYDFMAPEGATITDASGRGHAGTLFDGTLAFGRRRDAVRLDGTGHVVADGSGEPLDPAGRALTVGALCQPLAPDGVLAAMGDQTNGFCLYLAGGVPRFAVRSGGVLAEVAGPEPLPVGQWVHLAGAIDADGTVSLMVNTWTEAKAPGAALAARPAEPFAAGADLGAPVVDAGTLPGWTGMIEDVRLYWGRLDRDADADDFKDWANLPGCGCK